MCGRFTYLTGEEFAGVVDALEGGTGLVELDCGVEREMARPRSHVQAVVWDGGAFGVAQFTWGFRPTQSTDVVFNTRIESALGGVPLWACPLRDGRCILPVASFFEPHRSETSFNPKTGRQAKRQYEFADPRNVPLLLASIHDGSCVSVLTTEPNAAVRPIHARMPLVLRFEEVPLWLDGDYAPLADRSAVELSVLAEAIPDQLTLF